MTWNVPGKVPITERSLEKPMSTINMAVVWRSSPHAKQPFVNFIFSGYLRPVTAEAGPKQTFMSGREGRPAVVIYETLLVALV